MFGSYLQVGFEHITDLEGYDHMLFLLALCASFLFSDWKRIIVLVTAFTVGHSVTLALAVLNIIPVNPQWIEFLIPVSILLTAVRNMLMPPSPQTTAAKPSSWVGSAWLLAFGFGLIHGMGFSNYLRALLGDDLLMPLFAFNIGLELGQLLVVAIIFAVQFILMRATSVNHRTWNLSISLLAGVVSLILAVQRVPF